MKLNREERQYVHYPFWGLQGNIPQVRIAGGTWQPMVLASSFDPGSTWAPPAGVTGSPDWFQALLAGPDATSNPAGTVVIPSNPTRLQLRVTAGDEIDILPDGYDEWIHLIA